MRAFAVVNYEQAVEPFLKTGHLSDTERAMLTGGACAKAYGWSQGRQRKVSTPLSVFWVTSWICELPLFAATPEVCLTPDAVL
jgi:hypothetical protein